MTIVVLEEGLWEIVIPTEATNYCLNPSFELWDNGGLGASLPLGWTRVNTQFPAPSHDFTRFGLLGCKIAIVGEGITQDITGLTSGYYVVSAHVYQPHGSGVGSCILTVTGTSSASVATTTDGWQRLSVTVPSSGTVTVQLTSGSALESYVDGVQVEDGGINPLAPTTTYLDGDQGTGYRWLGTAHLSVATRDRHARSGGISVNLSDYEIIVQDVGTTGIGMGPVSAIFQEYGSRSGSAYQGTKKQSRQLVLHTTTGALSMDLAHLQVSRSQLIEAIDPNLTATQQPFILRWLGNDIPVEIACVYTGGADWSAGDGGYSQDVMLACTAPDPDYIDPFDTVVTLTNQTKITNGYLLWQKDGLWNNMRGGVNGSVWDIRCFSTGDTYVTGYFDEAKNVGTSFANLKCSHIARWDGNRFYALADTGAGRGTDDLPFTVCEAYNGDVYLGGKFSYMAWDPIMGAGTSCNFVCRFDPVAKVYYNLGDSLGFPGSPNNGVNGYVQRIVAAPNSSRLILFGDFTKAFDADHTYPSNGLVCNRVVAYDPVVDRFYALANADDPTKVGVGSPHFGPNPAESVLDGYVDTNGTVYIAGTIRSIGTSTTGGSNAIDPCYSFAKYERNQWLPILPGAAAAFNGPGNKILRNGSGELFLFGSFTLPYHNVTKATGSGFVGLGPAGADGTNSVIRSATFIDGVTFHCVGDFTVAGNLAVNRAAFWSGSAWGNESAYAPASHIARTTDSRNQSGSIDLFLGFDNAQGTATQIAIAGSTAMVVAGTAGAYPRFIFRNTFVDYATTHKENVWIIANQTTRAAMWLNLSILPGEVIEIDTDPLTPGIISSIRGDKFAAPLAGSALTDMRLLRGRNDLLVFCTEPGVDEKQRITIVNGGSDANTYQLSFTRTRNSQTYICQTPDIRADATAATIIARLTAANQNLSSGYPNMDAGGGTFTLTIAATGGFGAVTTGPISSSAVAGPPGDWTVPGTIAYIIDQAIYNGGLGHVNSGPTVTGGALNTPSRISLEFNRGFYAPFHVPLVTVGNVLGYSGGSSTPVVSDGMYAVLEPGDVAASGDPATYIMTVEFTGSLAHTNVNQLVSVNGLASATITTLVQGNDDSGTANTEVFVVYQDRYLSLDDARVLP